MNGKINLIMPFGEELLNDKEALTNVVNGLLGHMGSIRGVNVEHLYVFSVGKDGAQLCFRKENDDVEFYRGGMYFNRSDIDTSEKARSMFVKNKELLNKFGQPYINRIKPLLFETSNVEVLLQMY